jgi:hypothetical protein
MKYMNDTRHSQRQPITIKRDCAIRVFTFNNFDWTDLHASIVDISNGGVGLQLDTPAEPGLVWFKDRVFGKHSGVLLWSKQTGSQYRSGIRFMPLSPNLEQFVVNKGKRSRQHEALKDLQHIVTHQLESMKSDTA